jgi:hypothetical protein
MGNTGMMGGMDYGQPMQQQPGFFDRMSSGMNTASNFIGSGADLANTGNYAYQTGKQIFGSPQQQDQNQYQMPEQMSQMPEQQDPYSSFAGGYTNPSSYAPTSSYDPTGMSSGYSNPYMPQMPEQQQQPQSSYGRGFVGQPQGGYDPYGGQGSNY